MSTRKVTRRNTGGGIVDTMLYIRGQIKLYHWQTHSFARHTATDELVKSLDENIDKFIEVYMGKYGRPRVGATIPIRNFSEQDGKRFVEKQVRYLTVVLPRKISPTDTDLLNIRDEILADINQTLFLFTLA
jgi:hypothetical protein